MVEIQGLEQARRCQLFLAPLVLDTDFSSGVILQVPAFLGAVFSVGSAWKLGQGFLYSGWHS